MSDPGKLVTLEGIEGSGKTTQIEILADYLRLRGHDILATREPGGTPVGDQIRKVLLNPEYKDLVPLAELFLYEAARVQHVEGVIKPALKAGKIVLCDRFYDATTAYQGGARKISMELVENLNQLASNGLHPRLTLLIDCPVEVGLKRARERYLAKEGTDQGDRLEQEELEFHRRVRKGYLEIAKRDPGRFVVIDGTLDIDATHQAVLKEIQRIL